MSYIAEKHIISTIGANSANYRADSRWNMSLPFKLGGPGTSVGTNGRSSAYGTFDQSGNGRELTDTIVNIDKRVNRGSVWGGVSSTTKLIQISSAGRLLISANVGGNLSYRLGFRVVSNNNPFSFNNFVSINDSGNSADITGYGDVNYNFMIGAYEVTNDEYCEFLNSVAATDTYNLYPTTLSLPSQFHIYNSYIYFNILYGITRSGSSGSYSYTVNSNMGNKPVAYISWFRAARYCNWLHNNKPSGLQNNSTTEDGAYTLNGATTGAELITKNIGANYWIPTENEWYKAAYYDPNKNGVGNPGYWLYATKSDDPPYSVFSSSVGDGLLAHISIDKVSSNYMIRKY